MKTFAKILATAAVAMVAAPASAAPLLYSYFESGSETARFTFILDDKPRVSPVVNSSSRKGFGANVDLTLFWTSQSLPWYVEFYSSETGGGFMAGEAFSSGVAVGQQLFSGSVTNPTMLTGRFNLVDQYFGNIAVLTVAAIPEPATWAMMLVGFGMVGGAARYRRRVTKVTYA